MSRAAWISILSAIFLSRSLAAQQDSSSVHAFPDTLITLSVPADSGRLRLTPILAPGYNPDLHFLVAGGVLLSWKTGANKLAVERSTLASTLVVSTTGAISISNGFSGFWREGALRTVVGLTYRNKSDNYWGVGYEAGLRPFSSDSTTEYHRKWLQFNPLVLGRIAPNLFVGGSFDFNKTVASDINPRMSADQTFRRFGRRNANVGLGFALQYDSRDVTVNAWRGSYLGLSGTFYGSYLGGDNGYQIFQADYRRYHPLGRPGRILAWQLKARVGTGAVPWAELPLLGTVYDLRGYLDGRFRDRSTLFGLVEYRHTFLRSSGRLSRHGFVTWVGGGTLGRDPAHFRGFLPNAGLGYRFELQPRSNIRMDFGVGRHAHGVYFNFTEAF